jgi:hypothetical protein
MDKRTKLLVSNIPASCTESFLQRWVEARGYRVFKVNLIRDTISGTSPSFAYVQLMDESRLDEAARAFDGQCVFGSHLASQSSGSVVRYCQTCGVDENSCLVR